MKKENIKLLSDEIKLQRFKKNKTQDDCAKALNKSIPTYKNFEDNPNKLELEQILILFNFLEYTDEEIKNIFLQYILHNVILKEN